MGKPPSARSPVPGPRVRPRRYVIYGAVSLVVFAWLGALLFGLLRGCG